MCDNSRQQTACIADSITLYRFGTEGMTAPGRHDIRWAGLLVLGVGFVSACSQPAATTGVAVDATSIGGTVLNGQRPEAGCSHGEPAQLHQPRPVPNQSAGALS